MRGYKRLCSVLIVLLIPLALGFAAAGCGGATGREAAGQNVGDALLGPTVSAGTTTGSPVPPAGPPETAAEFAAHADAICARYLQEASKFPVPATPAQLAAQSGAVAEIVRRQRGELASLRPPTAEAANVRTWLDTQRRLQEAYLNGANPASLRPRATGVLSYRLRHESLALGLERCFVGPGGFG